MSHKLAKEARKWLRDKGIDTRSTKYEADAGHQRKFFTGRINHDGAPEQSAYMVPGTVRLTKGCGRELYKDTKKQMRRHQQSIT